MFDRRQFLLGALAAAAGGSRPAAARALAAGSVHAVIAGVTRYGPEIPGLSYAVSDAARFRAALGDPGVTASLLLSWEEREPLSREASEPTRANLLRAVREAAARTTPDDLFLFYFSGHGMTVEAGSYLLPADAAVARLQETALSVTALRDLLADPRACPARTRLLVLDACHSGSAKGFARPRWAGLFGGVEGIFTLAAAEIDREAFEFRDLGGGVFTHFLARGLSGEAAPGKPSVSLEELRDYVVAQVNAACQRRGRPPQNPVFLLPEGAARTLRVRPSGVAVPTVGAEDRLASRPRLAEGLVLLLRSEGQPARTAAARLKKRLLDEGYPLVADESAAVFERVLTGEAAPAGAQTARLNAGYLVRGTVETRTDLLGGDLRGFTRATVSLSVEVVDVNGRLLATETPLPAGRPVIQARTTAQAAIDAAQTEAADLLARNLIRALKRADGRP